MHTDFDSSYRIEGAANGANDHIRCRGIYRPVDNRKVALIGLGIQGQGRISRPAVRDCPVPDIKATEPVGGAKGSQDFGGHAHDPCSGGNDPRQRQSAGACRGRDGAREECGETGELDLVHGHEGSVLQAQRAGAGADV